MKKFAFLITFLLGSLFGMSLVTATQAPPAVKENPAHRSLDSNLYMQTSAEYRACCLQAYAFAELRLSEKVKARDKNGKPPAVVLDLDETVLENSAFQAAMIRSDLAYNQSHFDAWEKNGGAMITLVPGSKEFLAKAKELGVSIVYISNRNEKYRQQTMASLDRLGIAVPTEQLHLATTTSDKTARRKKATDAFDVILLVGDNLRDFEESFRFNAAGGVEGRKKVVDDSKNQFGTNWIILPNPAYGEWMKPFSMTAKDTDFLVPSFELKP